MNTLCCNYQSGGFISYREDPEEKQFKKWFPHEYNYGGNEQEECVAEKCAEEYRKRYNLSPSTPVPVYIVCNCPKCRRERNIVMKTICVKCKHYKKISVSLSLTPCWYEHCCGHPSLNKPQTNFVTGEDEYPKVFCKNINIDGNCEYFKKKFHLRNIRLKNK